MEDETESRRTFLRKITVEPVLFLYMLGIFMQYVGMQDLVYIRVCARSFPSAEQNGCRGVDAAIENAVQTQASHLILLSTVALTLPSILSVAYLGWWSDALGRKSPLLLPCLGNLLSSVIYVLISALDWPIEWINLGSSVAGISGGFVSVIMGVMAYVSASSSAQSRTIRIAILEAMSALGGVLGPFLGSYVLNAQSHAWLFFHIVIINTVAIFYILVFLPEIQSSSQEEEEAAMLMSSFLSPSHLVEAWRCALLKPRLNRARVQIAVFLVASFVLFSIAAGENDVSYLFVKSAPLNWNYDKYSRYFALRYGLTSLGLLFVLPLIKRYYYGPYSDTLLCLLGILGRIAGYIVLSMADVDSLVYAAPLSGLLSSWAIPTIRSCLSQLVAIDEEGKLFAVVASIETLSTLVGSLVFNGLYPVLRSVSPGFVFDLAAILLLIPFCLIWWLHHARKCSDDCRYEGDRCYLVNEAIEENEPQA